MSVFVLVPGAGGAAWYWHRVVPELRARGHEAVAVDLPGADESAGLPEYADAVAEAIGGRHDVVLVAQSMGGFTAPVVCARIPVRLLVLLNAMIPLPGETPGAWWDNTGWEPARIAAARAGGYPAEFDLATYFLHDVPAEVVATGRATTFPRPISPSASPAPSSDGRTCPPGSWPDVTTGSSRWSSSAGSRGSGSAPRSTRSPAGIWSPCPVRPSSPTS